MASKKEEKEKKRSRGYADMMFVSYKRRMFYGFMRTVRNILGIALVCLFGWFLISGGINQAKTGQNLVDYALVTGQKVGNFFKSLFTNDSPLKVNEDGIYLKDANVPKDAALPGPNEEVKEVGKDGNLVDKKKNGG